MYETLVRSPVAPAANPTLAAALAHAAAAIARLDQALANHPLRPAFLYRARLEAVRRQAAVDGQAIDPWHLAAILEGLRLRMDHALRIIDRGTIFAAARHALGLHQWLTAPDFDQEAEIQCAETVLAEQVRQATPLLAAATGFHGWLGAAARERRCARRSSGTGPGTASSRRPFLSSARPHCAPTRPGRRTSGVRPS